MWTGWPAVDCDEFRSGEEQMTQHVWGSYVLLLSAASTRCGNSSRFAVYV